MSKEVKLAWIPAARDHHASTGEHLPAPYGPAADQSFEDWAADLVNKVLIRSTERNGNLAADMAARIVVELDALRIQERSSGFWLVDNNGVVSEEEFAGSYEYSQHAVTALAQLKELRLKAHVIPYFCVVGRRPDNDDEYRMIRAETKEAATSDFTDYMTDGAHSDPHADVGGEPAVYITAVFQSATPITQVDE